MQNEVYLGSWYKVTDTGVMGLVCARSNLGTNQGNLRNQTKRKGEQRRTSKLLQKGKCKRQESKNTMPQSLGSQGNAFRFAVWTSEGNINGGALLIGPGLLLWSGQKGIGFYVLLVFIVIIIKKLNTDGNFANCPKLNFGSIFKFLWY